MLILTADDVHALLDKREPAIIEIVRRAYLAHGRGASSLPQSVFLRFPESPQDRIIGLPAYVGEDIDVAGIKWIASFPGNVSQGLDRASATIILNSAQTGHPLALLEGSLISAKRTAASAALAAATLHPRPAAHVALVGCGVINFEILRFLTVVFPSLSGCTVYDLSPAYAAQFCQRVRESFPRLEAAVADSLDAALEGKELVSFATTAGTPYLDDPALFAPGSTVLHISLRDLTPRVILAADNVVDDVEHVCRAQTSVHLTSEAEGGRGFIRCTLADILDGRAQARQEDPRPVVFSPFGLGVLDLALAKDVYEQARGNRQGTTIPRFLPHFWQRSQGETP